MIEVPRSLSADSAFGGASIRYRLRTLLFSLSFILTTNPSVSAEPPASPFRKNLTEFDGSALFQRIASDQSGVDFAVPIDNDHPDDRLYYSAMACGSVSSGDLDGDGRADLFFACGAIPNRLYLQSEEDTFKFLDFTTLAGVADLDVWSTGAALADIDNDGDLDIYVCVYDKPNRLFINESSPGKPRFREMAKAFGVDIQDAGLMPSFADFDRDGDLDVFIAVNAYYRKGGRPKGGVPLRKLGENYTVIPPWDRFFKFSSIDPDSGEPKFIETGRANFLLRNDGDRGFTDVSKEAGLLRTPSHTNSAAWIDFDGDGWLDLYVGNDFTDRDEFYHNNGDGTFEEVAGDVFQHTTWFSMGSSTEDFNNDGMTDLIVADMLPTSHYRQKVTMGEMGASFDSMFDAGLPNQKMANAFFLNTGTGRFFETAIQSGLSQSDWTWTVKSGDFDGDGWIDLFFPNGHSRDFTHSDLSHVTPAMRIGKNYWDYYENSPELRETNIAFLNRDGFHFEPSAKKWGLEEKSMSYGATLADFDRDGDLDMVVMNLNDPPSIFRNTAAERGAGFVQVVLRGNREGRLTGNYFGIGAKLILELDDKTKLYRTLLPQNGYLESDEAVVHFGLGKKNVPIRSLTVIWPSGKQTYRQQITVGNRYVISEPVNFPDSPLDTPPASPLFKAEKLSSGRFNIRVSEDGRVSIPTGFSLSRPGDNETQVEPFNDYARQPLLPHKHSKLGPGITVGDVNGDGVDDFYLSGSFGKAGKIMLNRSRDSQQGSEYHVQESSIFPADKMATDLGAIFFEADGDGDLDLYVVSGSVECEPGDDVLRDRLYLNNGKGEFEAGALPGGPYSSGSVITATDFDRDGDLDLFVGGRIIPGQYPLPARSSLLINDGKGKFTDSTAALAPGLIRSGMVTAAIWSDADGDGWIDLLVAHEWGAIKFFHNKEGKGFEERTQSAGLSSHTGWWNSLAALDFDHDGDMDFVAGNFGHNTKYHPTPDHPEVLFYGDFDGSGKPHLIEAKYDSAGNCLPRRGFSCSRTVMPFLHGKMETFHNFASAGLEKIYSPELLASAKKFEVTTFTTSLLENDGSGKFTFSPLPDLAQVAPVFGIVATDFDSDGNTDLVLAQNFYSPQKETGPMDGGLSLFLRGSPTATKRFLPLWPQESGITLSGDAKGAAYCDLNGDLRPDFIIGMNGEEELSFKNTGSGSGRPIAVRLTGSEKGNPDAIGARVTLKIEGKRPQMAEVTAGSGYLSQSSPTLFFGLTNDSRTHKAVIEIRWPDGSLSLHPFGQIEIESFELIKIEQPPKQ